MVLAEVNTFLSCPKIPIWIIEATVFCFYTCFSRTNVDSLLNHLRCAVVFSIYAAVFLARKIQTIAANPAITHAIDTE